MKDKKKPIKLTKWLLPAAAALLAVIALAVVLFVPKNSDGKKEIRGSAQTEKTAAERNADGNLVIHADSLSSDRISFIRISEDSRIELLARRGDDGTAEAALGTCQSCNGSPGAYYTQEGNELKCNNCGLTFPLSVLDSPGGGCHPIMLDEGLLRYEGNDLIVDLAGLSVYESLFSKVADH